jgi:toxin FitB
VVEWLAEADEDRVFISVITLAELRHAIERMPAGTRRDRLDVWLTEQVPLRFARQKPATDVAGFFAPVRRSRRSPRRPAP